MYRNKVYSDRWFAIGIAGSISLAALADDSAQGLEVEPLESPSQPSGSTMFTELAPEETGIDISNEYLDPRMWDDRYQEFALGAIGTGITVGDYDNDGRPDLFIVNKTGRSRLFRNLGDWKFQDVTDDAGLGEPERSFLDSVTSWFSSKDEEESVEAWKQGAVFADVNNDSWLDLYACRFGAPNTLYINRGDGSFYEAENAAGLGLSSASGMAAFCDFDRDGWLDAYLQTNMLNSVDSPDGNRDRLYRNNGDGTFTDITDEAGISGVTLGHSATCWDYNEDGWPDIYVANDFATPDQLYRNNGSEGSFSFTEVIDSVVPHQPFSSMGADLGDVNNDGRIDLFVADMAPTTHEMDQRGMAITRFSMQEETLDPEATPQYMQNALYLNSGTGRMREGAWMYGIARTDWTWSTRFEDLDNDGFQDLHVTNGMAREYQNDDLRQRIYRSANLQGRMGIMKSSPVLSESNLAYRNLKGKGFERVEQDWGLGQVGVSFGTAFGDFDEDGDLDLIYSNYEAPPTVLRNDSQGGRRAIFELRGTTSNHFGVGATVRIETASGSQVRQLVLARGYLSSSEPLLHFGLGEDETIDRATIHWPSGHVQTFEHLTSNNRFIVTEPAGKASSPPPNQSKPYMFEEFGEKAGLAFESPPFRPARVTPQVLAPFSFSRRGPTLASGDMNGDEHQDLVIGSFGGDSAHLLFGTPDRTFRSANLDLPIESAPDGPLLIEDFDGDGDMDLFMSVADPGPTRSEAPKPRLLLNNGDGSLVKTPKDAIPEISAFAGSASAADFNRDGMMDIFIGSRALPGTYPLPGRSALLANRGGRFEDLTDDLLPVAGEIGLVTGSLWSDVDDDGWPDLIVTMEWGQVKYFRNINGKRFEDITEKAGFASAGTGLWSCISKGDFNGDGKPDFVVGNIGLNTRYRANADSPAVLYFGNFGGRRPGQLVEARYENGRLVPLRSRKELVDAIPPLARRFQSTDAYAAATLEEILGTQALSKAQRLEATQLRSGVFLSRGDGTYKFNPLPWIAQIAPIQGIAIADFNGDGNLDLAATQNLHDVDPSIGRFDGGLGQLLLGNGHGEFTAIEPSDSGLTIPGDGKNIVATDIDGDGKADIIATRAGSRPLVFRNLSVRSQKN